MNKYENFQYLNITMLLQLNLRIFKGDIFFISILYIEERKKYECNSISKNIAQIFSN